MPLQTTPTWRVVGFLLECSGERDLRASRRLSDAPPRPSPACTGRRRSPVVQWPRRLQTTSMSMRGEREARGGVVWSDRARRHPCGWADGPFPRPACRTGRARSHASGSPSVRWVTASSCSRWAMGRGRHCLGTGSSAPAPMQGRTTSGPHRLAANLAASGVEAASRTTEVSADRARPRGVALVDSCVLRSESEGHEPVVPSNAPSRAVAGGCHLHERASTGVAPSLVDCRGAAMGEGLRWRSRSEPDSTRPVAACVGEGPYQLECSPHLE